MTKRIKQLALTISALAALALGGAVFASAQTTHAAGHEKTAAVDTDNIQSGDQTSPDASKVKHATVDPAGGGAGQSGSQTAPDTGSVSETAGETGATSESAPSDGPGGHADATTGADHQFQGVE